MKLLTPEELAEINERDKAYCEKYANACEFIEATDRTALLKHIRGMENDRKAWDQESRITELEAQLEVAEADAVLSRGMEVTERERADKAEARLRAIGEWHIKWKGMCIDLESDAELKALLEDK